MHIEQAHISHQEESQSSGAVMHSMRRPADSTVRVLWRDHLRVGLSPQWLSLARYRRGLRPRLSETEALGIAAAEEGPAWRAPIEALRTAMERNGQRRTDVAVVLSSHYARYALLPWNAAIKRDAEWLALARHRFAAVHGNAADDWVIRVCSTGHQCPRIASAIDSELLLALEEIMPPGAALTSVQPYLIAAYNRLQQTILKERCWFVVEEPGRLTLAFIDHGIWKAIKTRRRDVPSGITLPDILDRETALLALEEPCSRVVLCSYAAPSETDSRAPYRIEDHTGVDYAERQLAMVVE